jgi:hypothetical protein
MKVQIISTTDSQFLGHVFDDETIPVILPGDFEFVPDAPPMPIGGVIKRYYNANYSIDVQPYTVVSDK